MRRSTSVVLMFASAHIGSQWVKHNFKTDLSHSLKMEANIHSCVYVKKEAKIY